MTEPLRRKHHYRPILHLRHFAGTDGRVWVHHRSRLGAPQPTDPKNVGFETFLYAPGEGTEAPRSDAFERWLERYVDTPAVDPLGRLAAGAEPSDPQGRLAVARFIVAQDMRTPSARDLLTALFQRGIEAEWPTVVAESLKALGLDATADAVQQAAAAYAPRVTNVAWLGLMRDNVLKAAYKLASRPWTLVSAPDGYDWLTSDLGIAKFVGSFEHPVRSRLGWAEGAEYWLFPVSSRLAVAIAPGAAPSRAEARPAWLKLVNRQLAADARRFVAARTRSEFVQRWWQASPTAG